MFGQSLNDATALRIRKLIPLEIPPGVVKHCAELVTLEFIRTKDSECLGIVLDDLIKEFSNRLHATCLTPLLHLMLLPIVQLQGFIPRADQFLLTKAFGWIFGTIDKISSITSPFSLNSSSGL